MILEVCRAFESNLASAAAEKDSVAQTLEKHKLNLRHRLFLKRKVKHSSTNWQPVKRYRLSTKHWVMNIDNSMQGSLGLAGLKDFKMPEPGSASFKNWRTWKHLILAIDQGSDGLSGTSWLQSQKINISTVCDWSHGIHNDMKESLRASGLWHFMLLMMIVMNVECGPYKEDMRHAQVQEAWADIKSSYTGKNCVMFKALAPRIFDDFRCFGNFEIGLGQDPEEALWTKVTESSPLHNKGYITNLNRFMAMIERGRELLGSWHLKLLQYALCTIECGMMSGGKWSKLVFKQPAGEDPTVAKSTSSERVCITERALRSSCQNALVIATLMLEEPWNHILLKIICSAAEPAHEWFKDQSHRLRDTDSSRKWLVEQLDGGFSKHVGSILGRMTRLEALSTVGLTVAGLDTCSNDDVLVEDEIADVFGEVAATLAGCRVTRCLWLLRGWPVRMAGLMGPPRLQEITLDAFRDDLLSFRALEVKRADADVSLNRFYKRSVFHQASVIQYVQVSEWEKKGASVVDYGGGV